MEKSYQHRSIGLERSKNVFNRVVHYQLVRGIDEEKREEMEENK